MILRIWISKLKNYQKLTIKNRVKIARKNKIYCKKHREEI
jgi:hypothetical protein